MTYQTYLTPASLHSDQKSTLTQFKYFQMTNQTNLTPRAYRTKVRQKMYVAIQGTQYSEISPP